MAAVLQFDSERARSRRQPDQGAQPMEAPAGLGEVIIFPGVRVERTGICLLYPSPSPRHRTRSRMPFAA